MSIIKRIVTSEVEGRNLSDFYGDNSYSFDTAGRINYYGRAKMGPVIEPGILYGSNADSGDGYGYNTIKLIPHAPDGQSYDDRYLIIDPTAPNHIHIRAGGIQDASNAQLFLGAEKNHVRVDDNNKEVVISSKQNQTVQAVLNVNDISNDYLLFNDIVPVVAYSGWYIEVNGIKYYVNDVIYPTEGQTQAYVPGAPLQSQGVYNMFSPEETNEWQFESNGVLYGPAEDGQLEVAGIRGESGHPTMFIGPDSIVLDGNNGEFLNDPSNPDNQIARIADLTEDSGKAFQSVQWSPNFEATGLVFSGSGTTYPTYNSYYVKQGQLVSFWITIDLSTVTAFGTGQLKTALPFAPLAGTMNHFSGWVFVDETANPDLAGHIILNADHLPNTTVLDLHYLKQDGGANSPVMEAMLIQGTPVTLTTNTNIYINGTYIAAS